MDRRQKRTRRAIREAYAALLGEKDFDRLTVRELTHRADVSRGAFYLYYHDLYDLRDKLPGEICDELLATALEYGRGQELKEPYPYLVATLNYIVDNAAVCKLLLRERGGEEFRRRLTEATREIIGKEWVEPRQKNYDRTALRYFSLCAVHGFAAAVIQWLEEDMPETPRELADILGNVLDYGIDALRKGSQGNG